MLKAADLINMMSVSLKTNWGTKTNLVSLGAWAMTQLYKLEESLHTLDKLSSIAQLEYTKRNKITATT